MINIDWSLLVSAEERGRVRKAAIAEQLRAEARRRILAVYPEWKQLNMTARGVELMRKGEANWTPEEAAEAEVLQAAWNWIKAVRDASNTMEVSPPADFRDDSHWPVA